MPGAGAAVILKGRYERYVGVDLSPGVIEAARRTAADVQSAEFIAANIKDAPLPDAIADVVFCNGSLHHMTDLPGVMGTLKRIAKPGAWFSAREPQRGNPLIGALRAIRKVVDPSYSSDQRYFSRREIIDLARDAGLTQVEVCSQGLLTPPLALVMWRLQALAVPPARIAVKLEDPLERIMRGPLARMSWNVRVYGRFP